MNDGISASGGMATQAARSVTSDVGGYRRPNGPDVLREFEALFLAELWRAMRQTLSGSGPLGEAGPFGTYSVLLDQELATWLAGAGTGSIGPALAEALSLEQEEEESPRGVIRQGEGVATTYRPYRAGGSPDGLPGASAAASPSTSTASSTDSAGGLASFFAVARRVLRHDPEIARASQETGVDQNLLRAVVHQESGGDARARSSRGAMGLMQLIPATARQLGVDHPFLPWENLRAGAEYLRDLLNRFRGDLVRALAAYNAGPEAVARAGGVPPYAETEAYVPRVIALAEEYRRVEAAGFLPSRGSASAPSVDE